jgi:hypothetical protein
LFLNNFRNLYCFIVGVWRPNLAVLLDEHLLSMQPWAVVKKVLS